MVTSNTSASSKKELRERLAELGEKYQREVTHGDVVSRADVQAEIKQTQAQLRALEGIAPPPIRNDEAFFRGPQKIDKFAEARSLVDDLRRRGLIRDANSANPVKKNGAPVASEGSLLSQWIDVTPALAKEWLENNFVNRTLSEDVVAAYARDMTNGVWVSTHQGIAFNDRDELIDGQHRLHGIVLSGVTVRMMVTFGLPSKIKGKEMTTMDAVDRGRTRSVADQLKIQHGLKDGSLIAAISALLGSICFGTRTRRLSVGQTLEIFRAFENPILWIIAHRDRRFRLPAGVLAGFSFALATEREIEAGPIALMFERLVDGENLLPNSPVEKLRLFLTSDAAKLLTRGGDRGLSELVLQAIYLQSRGTAVEVLEPSVEGVDFYRKQQPGRVAKIAAIFQLPD